MCDVDVCGGEVVYGSCIGYFVVVIGGGVVCGVECIVIDFEIEFMCFGVGEIYDDCGDDERIGW